MVPLRIVIITKMDPLKKSLPKFAQPGAGCCVYGNDDFGDFWGDDDDMHCKISNICEDKKSATGSSQEAAGVDFDFQFLLKVFA